MKITREEVDHLAKLARIKLTKEEKEKYRGQLSSILEYVNKLKRINNSSIELINQESRVINVSREDKVIKFAETDRLIDLAPDKENNFVKVKAVLK